MRDQHPGAVTGVRVTGFLDDAVGGGVHGCADRARDVDAVMQGAPAVAEAGGEQSPGRKCVLGTLQQRLPLCALGGEGNPAGEFLAVGRVVDDGLDRHKFGAPDQAAAVGRRQIGGQHGAGGGLRGGLDRDVGRGRRCPGRHCGDQGAPFCGAGGLAAVLGGPRQNVGDLGAAEHRLFGAPGGPGILGRDFQKRGQILDVGHLGDLG